MIFEIHLPDATAEHSQKLLFWFFWLDFFSFHNIGSSAKCTNYYFLQPTYKIVQMRTQACISVLPNEDTIPFSKYHLQKSVRQ